MGTRNHFACGRCNKVYGWKKALMFHQEECGRPLTVPFPSLRCTRMFKMKNEPTYMKRKNTRLSGPVLSDIFSNKTEAENHHEDKHQRFADISSSPSMSPSCEILFEPQPEGKVTEDTHFGEQSISKDVQIISFREEEDEAIVPNIDSYATEEQVPPQRTAVEMKRIGCTTRTTKMNSAIRIIEEFLEFH
jgi:hypothetical protein